MARPRLRTGADAQTKTLTAKVPKSIGAIWDALERVHSYRDAARAIRRGDAALNRKLVGMIDLMGEARRERDPWVRSVSEGIVWAQSAWLLEGDKLFARIGVRDQLERAARELRDAGYERCPRCHGQLSDPVDWTLWRSLAQRDLDRLEALDRDRRRGGEAP